MFFGSVLVLGPFYERSETTVTRTRLQFENNHFESRLHRCILVSIKLLCMDWSIEEVTLIVSDYFAMLKSELIDEPYNKTEHRKNILPFLNGRNESSIEFKHRNISAVLLEMGSPFIRGYKPMFNYQQLLVDAIVDYLNHNQSIFEYEFEKFVKDSGTVDQNVQVDFRQFLSEEPVISKVRNTPPSFTPKKKNYLEQEQSNTSLGEAGEKLIIDYERWRLMQSGKESLAEKIEWVSKEQGDGAGFDILSKNLDGSDRFIEVKTTKLSKETPIFLTSNELAFASTKKDDFFLYRVFECKSRPQFFWRKGAYDSFCILKPQVYGGYFF
jgi:hypothetical protein